jgi:hypothetical protein
MEETLISPLSVGILSDPSFKKGGDCSRLDCQKALKEELKSIWAAAVLSDRPLFDLFFFRSRALRALKSPFSRGCPIVEVLVFLLSQKMGYLTPPLIPRYTSLPVFELCQLALLWSIAKLHREASSLAHSISSLIDYPYLWSTEEETNTAEVDLSLAFFRAGTLQSTENIPPFFLAMSRLFVGFDVPCSIKPFSPEPFFFYSSSSRGVLSLLGRRTGLGTFYASDIEVRAFGPQSLPLNDPKGFGIERSLQGEDRWTQVSSLPEVWLEVKNFFESGLEVRFLGLNPKTPLHFSFYIKAPSAQIGTLQLLPKSLIRYQGESKPVLFGGKLQIESLLQTKMEVIPLAGEGCFWGAEFLLSFEINSLDSRGLFQWNLVY